MNAEAPMYSLEQVAERLGLHVRTVRSYVRSGRLKAVRIGKQYRVRREDLEALTGPTAPRHAVPRHRRIEASSVVQVDAISKDTARRITNHLLGAANAPRDDGSVLRVETIYDEERGQMKVIVIGSLAVAADLFRLLGAILEV
jgi:excisionase family DNA binding protein